MKQLSMLAVLLLLVVAAGCQNDDYARRIVAPDTTPGRIDAVMGATADALVAQGRISLHRKIPMADKINIDVWVIKARNAANQPVPAKGTMLIVHSLYDGKTVFPFRGAGERLAKMGYDVVLPDLRKHGSSGGDYVTYGAKESQDLKTVMDTLIAENNLNPKVYAFGVNLGGATAIQYAAVDERCKGVMAVAPYRDLRGIMKHWYGRLLFDEDFDKVITLAGRIGDFDPNAASALEAVKKIKCPLLLVHGLLDMSVPLDHSKALFAAANEPKALEIMGGLEQIVLPAAMEDWVANNMDKLARTGVQSFGAATRPAGS